MRARLRRLWRTCSRDRKLAELYCLSQRPFRAAANSRGAVLSPSFLNNSRNATRRQGCGGAGVPEAWSPSLGAGVGLADISPQGPRPPVPWRGGGAGRLVARWAMQAFSSSCCCGVMMASICCHACWRSSLIFWRFCCGVRDESAHTDSTYARVFCSMERRCSMTPFEIPPCCQHGCWRGVEPAVRRAGAAGFGAAICECAGHAASRNVTEPTKVMRLSE